LRPEEREILAPIFCNDAQTLPDYNRVGLESIGGRNDARPLGQFRNDSDVGDKIFPR
jgi:hypothetical protein